MINKEWIPCIIWLYKTWYLKEDKWKINGLRIWRSESESPCIVIVDSLSGLTSLSQVPLPFIHPPCECQKKLRYVLASFKVLCWRTVIFFSFSQTQSSVAARLRLISIVQKWRQRVGVVNSLGKGYDMAKEERELKAARWFNWRTQDTCPPWCTQYGRQVDLTYYFLIDFFPSLWLHWIFVVACGVLVPPTRDWTLIPCIGRCILNHWTTREVPWVDFKS